MNNKNKSYSEILAFLEIVDEEYVERIPKKLLELFKREKDESYLPKYNAEIPIEEQNVMKETRELIAILYLNYWYESEEDKAALEEIYSKNTLRIEQEAREKYNPDNIFKQKDKQEQQEIVAMVEYKESFFKKLLNKIKSILRIGKFDK